MSEQDHYSSTSTYSSRIQAKNSANVAGISEVAAETPEEVMYMLHKGNKERTQEPTKANKTSSRSHAVLQVNIKQRNKVRTHAHEIRLGKLYMIDLAGSERAAQTQNTGKRMVEGAHINRSLLALGNCINALSEKGSSKYVNYRDSKLTRILKDSLGGNSKTVMIAHISPASIHFEESRNTLTYADRAKYIRTKLRRNVIDVSYHISQYQQIIQELAAEIATLKEQKYDLEAKVSHLDPRINAMMTSNNSLNSIQSGGNNFFASHHLSSQQQQQQHHQQYNVAIVAEDKFRVEETLKLRESLLQAFKQQIKLRKNVLDLENAITDINIEAERHNKIIENWNSSRDMPQQHDADTVLNAREELKVVEADRDELDDKRLRTLKELEIVRAKTRKLRDQATKKLSNSEQKEILSLLLKNFEFEIRNIEIQAELFKREFKLREQDLVILRLEQHRSLCDTLILQQRKLIVDNNLSLPSDLNELYNLYSRDTTEGQLVKDLSSLRSNSTTSFNANSPKPHASTFLTQIQEEQHGLASKFAKGSQKNKSINNNNFYLSNANNVNTASPQQLAAHGKQNRNNTSNLSSSSNDTEIIVEGSQSVSNKQTIRTAPRNKTGAGNNFLVNQPGQVVLTGNGVNQQQQQPEKRLTHNIAAIAAQRKAKQHHKELMQELDTNENNNNDNSESFVLTSSRNQNQHQDESGGIILGLEKKNSVLTDGSNGKVKKQVKIRDIVQYKLPDDNYYSEEMAMSFSRGDGGASPFGKSDDARRDRKKNSNNKADRSKSQQNNSQSQVKALSQAGSTQNSLSLNNLTNNSNQQASSSVAGNNTSNKLSNNGQSNKATIPNYTKGVNFSIAGTSMLKN